MADTSFQVQYKDEFIEGIEQGWSLLRDVVATDAMTKGNQAVFDIVDSGGASAVTRGVNGLIPARADNETQVTLTLNEWHDLTRKTSFNIFASQGDGRQKMQMTTRKVINRKIDDDIIACLTGATNTGSNGAITLAQVQANLAKLGRQDVEVEDPEKIVILASMACRAELEQLPTFNSHDYVDMKPLAGGLKRVLRWAGATWVFSNRLPGAGTSTETCFMFHRDAIGHAANTSEMSVAVGYQEEQDYSFCRASMYMGSVILQQKGLLKFTHDGSAIG